MIRKDFRRDKSVLALVTIGFGLLPWAINGSSAQAHDISVAERLEDPRPIIIAHRACWHSGPENSLRAIKACIDIGVDVVKIDMRTTKDNVVVLLHDETLDRTTSASGPLKTFTYAKLQHTRLRDGAGGAGAAFTDQGIPTLKEALRVGNGQMLFALDVSKEENQNRVFEVVRAAAAEDRVIFIADPAAGSPALRNSRFVGKSAFMPIIWQCESGRDENCYRVLSDAVRAYRNFAPVAFVAFADRQSFVDVRSPPTVTGTLYGNGSDDESFPKQIGEGIRFFFTDYPEALKRYTSVKSQ